MKFSSHFDKVALGTIFIFSFFLLGMFLVGDFTLPRIQYFNAATGEVSPQQGQFLFRFNRLMNEKTVEQGFSIVPAVKGQFSWSGRTFAFTAIEPLQYGAHYTLVFRGAEDRAGKKMEPVTFQAHTRPESVLFLDSEGQIVQLNLASAERKSISPANLFIQQFSISPDGNFVAFLGANRHLSDFQDRTNFRLSVLKLSDQSVTSLPIDAHVSLDNIHWLPDASAVAFSYVDMKSNKEGLRLYELNTRIITELAPGKARAYDFYFTPDSAQVAYIDTNGALILGAVPSGNGSLVATTFTEMSGFSASGDRLGYILPRSVDPFDLSNVPVLVDADGNEERLPVPTESTSFDVTFVPNQTKVVFTLEESLGSIRKNTIYSYDYATKKQEKLINNDTCTAVQPSVSPDASLIVWQCVRNDNKGYLITGWNDYQGKMVTAELWLKDLMTGEERNLGVMGAQVQFVP